MRARAIAMWVGVALVGACAASDVPGRDAPSRDVDHDVEEILGSNALISNALISNALRPDGHTEGELARQFLSYAYSCAMPLGATLDLKIDGQDRGTLHGALGLAPQWGEPGGSCDETCQRWVTACLLSRTNFWGVPVKISLRSKITWSLDRCSAMPASASAPRTRASRARAAGSSS